MKKNSEYREPEFTVINTAQQDVLTASGDTVLGNVTSDWDTIGNGGGVSFGL